MDSKGMWLGSSKDGHHAYNFITMKLENIEQGTCKPRNILYV